MTMTEFPPAPINIVDIDEALSYGWMPDNVGGAEWAARKLDETYEELAGLQAEVQSYVERVKAWAQTMLHTGHGGYLVKRAKFFEDALKRYGLTLRDESGTDDKGEAKIKTIKLPSAVIRTRAGKAEHFEWEVLNHEALLAWCEEYQPDAVVRVVELTLLGDLRVVETQEDDDEFGNVATSVIVNEHGERVPGIGHRLVEARPPSATVSLVKDDVDE